MKNLVILKIKEGLICEIRNSEKRKSKQIRNYERRKSKEPKIAKIEKI